MKKINYFKVGAVAYMVLGIMHLFSQVSTDGAFGLQAFFIDKPGKQTVLVSILISIVVFILSFIYFHPLAYSFIAFSLLCFVLSFFKIIKEIK